MASKEYRDLRLFEVAEYDYAQKRITITVTFDRLEDAITSWVQMLLANDVPTDRIQAIRDKMTGALLRHETLYEHECLATNRRVSLIIRK